MKATIGNTLDNKKCRLCGNRNEKGNHNKFIINESSKLAQKEYNTRHALVKKADYKVKTKENKKIDKFFDYAR